MSQNRINKKCLSCYQADSCMLTELMTKLCLGPFYNHFDALYKIRRNFWGSPFAAVKKDTYSSLVNRSFVSRTIYLSLARRDRHESWKPNKINITNSAANMVLPYREDAR